MNKRSFDGLHQYIQAEQGNICQIVAYKGGRLAYEDYWNGFARHDAAHVMSVTKSVVALLIGIAMDEGLIDSVEQNILDFFPDYQVKRGERTIQEVKLRHLLTLTAPFKYRSEPWTRVCTSEDWTVAALDLLGGKAGLTGEFKYTTLGLHILTGILHQVSGETTAEFANKRLFAPLGIPAAVNICAETAEEHKAFIMDKQPRQHLWFVDPMDIATAGFGLCLSAFDMAKIGELCRNKGVCGGQRIVSAQWIEECTRPRYQCGEEFAHMQYGYLWWIVDQGSPAYAAIGDGGNVIFVDPAQGVTVAVTGTFKPRIYDRVPMIQQRIVPLL